jgi:hypothetical protein
MMLIRYKSLDVTYYDSLYLSSKDIIRVEIWFVRK